MILPLPPLLLREHQPQKAPAKEAAPAPREQERKDKALHCLFCQARVTTEREKIEVQGGFRHTFLNPAGQVYEIGCFREAEGCQPIGPPSEEWAWFSGFSWRVALCGACSRHLGWWYADEARGLSFWGLILPNLI